jgi:CRISPR type IV-associated protein Csf1
MKTPELLTHNFGRTYRHGAERCYFCGGACDTSNSVRDFVPDTFTARNAVAVPGSGFACDGCVWTQRIAETLTVEGEMREHQKPWNYSWIVTANSARALTKAHIPILRDACLNPPEPPFAIALASSGQRHILYLTPVNESRGSYVIGFEGERIPVSPASLSARIDLTSRLSAAIGKPRLPEPPAFSVYRDSMARYRDGEAMADEWSRVWSEPLSRLAVFLTDRKDVCDEHYPSTSAA